MPSSLFPPPDLILKKMRPSRWIPLIVICWGITQTLMGLVETYTQLLSLRALLGFFECGLFPGLSFYLSSWYPRKELGLRIALFFSAATLAGVSRSFSSLLCLGTTRPDPSFSLQAFGGILGYGLSQMDGIGGKQGWSWIVSINLNFEPRARLPKTPVFPFGS